MLNYLFGELQSFFFKQTYIYDNKIPKYHGKHVNFDFSIFIVENYQLLRYFDIYNL